MKKVVDYSMMALAVLWVVVMVWFVSGCFRSIELVKEGDYRCEYLSVGLKTDVAKIEVEKNTNGSVRVVIDGVVTDVSEHNQGIVEASGTAVGNVAQKVVEGLK